MSKYYLIASYYNHKTNTYENETIIDSLEGNKLNTLYNIDSFTTSHTQLEILNLIEREKGKKGLNHLVIRYLKNQAANPEHFRPIINDKKFTECIQSSKQSEKYIQGKPRNTIYINTKNTLYKEELTKLLKILKTNDYDYFKNIYPYNNIFSSLINSYFHSNYDNTEEEQHNKKQIETEILLEFSRYKTFRGWYMNQLKIKNNTLNNRRNTPEQSSKTDNYNPQLEVKSIEEHEREYERNFKTTRGETYYEYNTSKYNEEYEEFLSEDEYKNMNDDNHENKTYKRH